MFKPKRLGDSHCYAHFFPNLFLPIVVMLLISFTASSVFAKNNPLYDKTITGTVVDETGQPLAGVSVLLKGTNTGVVTNAAGVFTIHVPDAGGTLIVSHVGFVDQEVITGERTEISVTLVTSKSEQLTDVVVVGYGTQKRVTVTGAVAQVKGAELAKTPTTNLSNTLAGRLSGVTAINYSGEPGYDGAAIKIRGTNSIGNSDALVVVDGVPNREGGLERINAADIESISVLKDAAAAIYGSRAANGVILVTTKRGKSGKPVLSYTFNQGWAQPTRIPKMSNVIEYGEMRNELAVYENLPPDQWKAGYDALIATGSYTRTDNGAIIKSPEGFTPDDMTKYRDGSDPWLHPNTDWFGTVFKNWSPQVKHNVQVTGGSENVRYLASLGYQNQDGYYKNSATGYKQYDLRLNLDAKINQYINVTVGLLGREEYRHFPTRSASDIFWMLMRGKPNEQAVWPNGLPGRDIEYGNNPVVITTNQTGYNNDKKDYIQSNGKLEILVPGITGLKLTGMAAIDKTFFNNKSWQTPWYLWQWNGAFEADGTTPVLVKTLRSNFTDARLSQSSATELSINLTGQLDYAKSFGDHNVSFLAGVQRETVQNEGFSAYRRYFISTALDQLFAGGDAEKDNGSSAWDRARLSYYGRVNYNYHEKYLAEFLWRYDGSYIFPQVKRFGFFPGVSAGWRISEEPFFKNNVSFVNNLKIRGSWGQMGAEPYYQLTSTLAEYQFLSTYGYSKYVIGDNVTKTLYETRLANPNFTWEVGNNSNIGIDASFLNSRLSLELDYFYNVRTGALIQNTGEVPATLGAALPPENLGKLSNKGLDFKLSYSDNAGQLSYSVSLTGGFNNNKVLSWSETPNTPDYQKYTGKRLGSSGQAWLVYESDGVFVDQAAIDANKIDYSEVAGELRPGDLKIKDINGDGKIDWQDQVRMNQTRDPYLTGGLSGSLQYKGFDFSFLLQGAAGGLQYFGTGSSGDIGNYLQYVYDHHWSVDNPSSTDPRIASRNNTWYTGGGAWNNDYWLRNSNYIRLKNAELGYTIPLPQNIKRTISNIRVFVNGFNIVTWDKMKIWDPESSANEGVQYPQSRIINIGGTITF